MVDRPLLSQSTVGTIGRVKRRGMATGQRMRGVPITLWRKAPHDVGGWLEGETHEVTIQLAGRQETTNAPNQGVAETAATGTFRAFGPVDVRRGDRFDWAGQTCVVDLPEPMDWAGVQTVRFHLLEGGA